MVNIMLKFGISFLHRIFDHNYGAPRILKFLLGIPIYYHGVHLSGATTVHAYVEWVKQYSAAPNCVASVLKNARILFET